MDDAVVQFPDPLDTATALGRARAAGASVWALAIPWAFVSPTEPPSIAAARDPGWAGYDWRATDAAVRAIARAHLQPLAVVQDAPRWAEGPNRPSTSVAATGTWDPSAKWLGAFATALARRYSGSFSDPATSTPQLPAVRYWEPWNEPNLAVFLTPQWDRVGGTERSESPQIYRRLLNAFYAAVKAVAGST